MLSPSSVMSDEQLSEAEKLVLQKALEIINSSLSGPSVAGGVGDRGEDERSCASTGDSSHQQELATQKMSTTATPTVGVGGSEQLKVASV